MSNTIKVQLTMEDVAFLIKTKGRHVFITDSSEPTVEVSFNDDCGECPRDLREALLQLEEAWEEA